MKTLYFDRKTLKGRKNKVCYLDIKKQVSDDCNISKTISKYTGDIQKKDENGNLIHLKNIYETVNISEIVGTEITTEVTDTPYMEHDVWKVNEEGFKLYSQLIYGEDGLPTGETQEVTNCIQVLNWRDEVCYEPTDEIIGEDEEGNPIYKQVKNTYSVPDKYEYNVPIHISVHKEDEDGNKLYIKNIIENREEKRVKETIETTEKIQVFSYIEDLVSRVETKFISCDHECDELCVEGCIHEHSEFCNPIYEDEEIIEIIEVPNDYEENEPCMIPSYKDVIVDLFSNPEEFTIIEVLSHIYEQELANGNYEYILADMFINENDIDFEYQEHSANTGAFVCCLHPNGKVRLKEFLLEKPAKVFELLDSEIPNGIKMFINDVEITGKKVMLPVEVESCIIRFENTTDKYLDIKSYCIAY